MSHRTTRRGFGGAGAAGAGVLGHRREDLACGDPIALPYGAGQDRLLFQQRQACLCTLGVVAGCAHGVFLFPPGGCCFDSGVEARPPLFLLRLELLAGLLPEAGLGADPLLADGDTASYSPARSSRAHGFLCSASRISMISERA